MIQKRHVSDNIEGSAVFSDDMKYRYYLTRKWDGSPFIHFIMLNPSIGDEKILETTTKGVMKRARNWGYGGMTVTNMYGLISTDPKVLREVTDPVGRDNYASINFVLEQAKINDECIVCAWGSHGLKDQKHFLSRLQGHPLHVLGLNKDGTPRHPLHMSHAIEPEPWRI